MMGERLYKRLTSNESFAVEKVKGRSVILINERNLCLLYRYYFYSKISRMRYDDLMTFLSNEFFLSERTTMDIITNNSEQLKKIFAEALTEKALQKKFNHLNWKI